MADCRHLQKRGTGRGHTSGYTGHSNLSGGVDEETEMMHKDCSEDRASSRLQTPTETCGVVLSPV